MSRPLPTRRLPARPDLDQLKRQAKELLDRFVSGDSEAEEEVRAHYRDADRAAFALHDAQLTVARAYGFESWPKLKAFVEGVTARRLGAAVAANDLAQARLMLKERPELGHASFDNLQLLHHAVFNRSVEMVRLLMEYGAPARAGVYPHRDATSALTIAIERGYDEIATVIEEGEQRQREKKGSVAGAPRPDAVFAAIGSGDDERAMALLAASPALVQARHAVTGWTPLHAAASRLDSQLVAWLLDRGADPLARDVREHVPLDWAAYSSEPASVDRFRSIAALLRGRGAPLTSPAAVVLGDVGWLRARHAEGTLRNPIEDTGGLLRIAVTHNRADIMSMLLEFGFDPDERVRVDFGDVDLHTFTWGMPLWHCAGSGKYELAELLLKHGADPNASVYASGDPVFKAYSERDQKMVKLLEAHGGIPSATAAGLFRQTNLAQNMLAGTATHRLERGGTVGEELLWGAVCGGDPEIARMALERVEWPRDDPRWFEMLEQPLRVWSHGSGISNEDREPYLACFRLLLERCDANVRGRVTDRQQFGLTILHSVAASREHLTPDDRVAFAKLTLNAGARLDLRDNLLKSTPLGWACRWGRMELVRLFLERGADPVERDAEPWATPEAWAIKKNHGAILEVLRGHG